MSPILRAICLASLALAAGCASDGAKRAAYHTLQNIGQQECEKGMSSDCERRESYDHYQREREKLKTPAAP